MNCAPMAVKAGCWKEALGRAPTVVSVVKMRGEARAPVEPKAALLAVRGERYPVEGTRAEGRARAAPQRLVVRVSGERVQGAALRAVARARVARARVARRAVSTLAIATATGTERAA